MIVTGVSFLLFNLIDTTVGFTLQSKPQHITRLARLQATPQSAPQSFEELFKTSAVWDPIKNDLNIVPAFACANEQGQPLQYNVGAGPLAFFFLDIDAAKDELQKAKEDTKMAGLTLAPFPLGEVFEMGSKQAALIIPSAESIEAAGAPKGTNPMGQQVPLFGCLDMKENRPDGSSMVPLFMNKQEAEEALGMALEGIGDEEKSKFEVTVVPLPGAVQMQASSNAEQSLSFTYIPAKSSLDYLRSLE